MTTDRLFIRGFSNGQPILHLSFDSSDAFWRHRHPRPDALPLDIARDRQADYGTGAS